MIDFTKWVDWVARYDNPPVKVVPLTAAELSSNHQKGIVCTIIFIGLLLVMFKTFFDEDASAARQAVVSVSFCIGSVIILIMLLFTIQTAKTVEETVSKPPSFIEQVENTFGTRNLSCDGLKYADSGLPAEGSYQCVTTYGKNDTNLSNTTLVVADHNKVGLYDANGKALEPVGKEK